MASQKLPITANNFYSAHTAVIDSRLNRYKYLAEIKILGIYPSTLLWNWIPWWTPFFDNNFLATDANLIFLSKLDID